MGSAEAAAHRFSSPGTLGADIKVVLRGSAVSPDLTEELPGGEQKWNDSLEDLEGGTQRPRGLIPHFTD